MFAKDAGIYQPLVNKSADHFVRCSTLVAITVKVTTEALNVCILSLRQSNVQFWASGSHVRSEQPAV